MAATLRRLQHVANVVVSQLNTAIVMAGSFVVTPAILYGLGDSQYGGWLLINSFISYMRFLDLGTSSGTVKFAAGAHERGDDSDLRRVFDTSTAMFLVLGALAFVATLGLTLLLPRLYPTIAGDQGTTILLLGLGMTIDMCLRPFAAALRMRSLFFVYDALEIVTYSIFKLGLVLYFAYGPGLSYRVLAFLTLGETAVRMLIITGAALVVSPAVRRIHPFRAERAMVRKLATMGAAVSIIMIADIVRFQVDAGVIGYFLPQSPESISIFGVGTRLASIAYTAIGVIGAVLMPKFSGLSETGDKAGLLNLLRRGSSSTGLVSSFVLVNIAVLGPNFLALWLKKPWIAESSRILLVVLPGYYIALLTGPSAGLLVGNGKLRGLTLLTVAEAIVNFVLSVVLIKAIGIIGVAIGTAIPLIVFRGVVFPILLHKEIGLRPLDYGRMHARAMGIGLVYLLLVGGLSWVPLTSYARFLLLGIGSTIIFLLLALALVPEVRAALHRRLRRSAVEA
jgi:O-antigen/teichoic acid export membrane protein